MREPQTPRQRLWRGTVCFLIGAALLGLGLVLTGNTGVAARLFRRSAHGIAPMPGSSAGPVEEVFLNGGREEVRCCRTAASVLEVHRYYAAVAFSEAAIPLRSGPVPGPVISSRGPRFGFLLWIDREGTRKAVLARRAAVGSRTVYHLVCGGKSRSLDRGHAGAPDGPELALPGGVLAPAGSRALFTLQRERGGFAIVEASGSPPDALGAFEEEMRGAGYGVRQLEPGTLAFAHDGVEGTVTAAPAGAGSHVAVVVHRSE